LPNVPVPFYFDRNGDSMMDSYTERLATLIEEAPLRAVTGLSASNEALRYWSTRALAEFLAEGLERPWQLQDSAQLALPL
jgi:hypothetical protein